MSDEYWEGYLRTNNGYDLEMIRNYYPKEKVITINMSKVLDNDTFHSTLALPSGEAELIVEAAKKILPPAEHNWRNLIVRFTHVTQKRKIKQLRTRDERKLIGIKSLIKRVTEVRPKIIQATFRCPAGHMTTVTPQNDFITPPHSCPVQGCDYRHLEHIDARDVKIDRQWLYIQDPLEDLTEGGQPSFLKCEVVEDLCGKVMAGDRVIVNGVYRSISVMKGGQLTSSKDVYFDTSSLEINEREFEEINLSPKDEIAVIEMSKDPEIFTKLTDSVAPSILGMKLLKQAIILMLFEGVTRKLKDGVVNRGHVNVLCVSDPGMAKTKLLRFVASISPRGVFTNATTSTKVGLIAPIIRDETTGEYTVQAGAYMIASGGTLCLDEVGELDKGEFKYLNEAMEDGEAHITKGGLNITVKTRASLLAACNPIEGSFDSYKPFSEQVKIPESTLSRFDLKILLQDISNDEKDRKMIEHITSTHMEGHDDTNLISPDMMRKYIAFGRKINPVLTKSSKKVIDEYYIRIRKETGSDKMKITPRQGTAVIRLAEAHARLRLSGEVSVSDAEKAVEIFDMCFRNVATDPITGKIDVSRVDHKTKFGLPESIIKFLRDSGSATEKSLLSGMENRGYDPDRVLKAVRLLKQEGKVIEPKDGVYRAM